jgi:hypothetical protein
MEKVYFVCAVFGGTLFACQFLMSLAGLGADHDFGGDHLDGGDHLGDAEHGADGHDTDHDSAHSWFLGVLSFRTIVAALTFFGLTGMAAEARQTHPMNGLIVASLAGVAALYIVAWTMRSLSRLRADGTVHIENAVGLPGIVYLTIPARRAGKGKVTVTLQDRTMEYEALTDWDDIPTGTVVQVVSVLDSETVEVIPAPELERSSHV